MPYLRHCGSPVFLCIYICVQREGFARLSFCKVHTEPWPRYFPGYYPYRSFCKFFRTSITRGRNFCEFCTTFIPLSETCVRSVQPQIQRVRVQHSYTYPCTTSVSYVQLPYRTWSFCDFYTRTRNMYNFCKASIPVPGTSGSSVRLWHNTRGRGVPL